MQGALFLVHKGYIRVILSAFVLHLGAIYSPVSQKSDTENASGSVLSFSVLSMGRTSTPGGGIRFLHPPEQDFESLMKGVPHG